MVQTDEEWWEESKETWGQFMQRRMPLAEKWWDDEQVKLDLTTVQGENDSDILWDKLDHDSKKELVMKIGHGSKQANAILLRYGPWNTWGENQIWGYDSDGIKLKKELRKLGVVDPSGTVLHEGRQLWKDLSIPERIKVFYKYQNLINDKVIKKQEEKLEKMKKENKELEKKEKRKSWFGF